MRGWRKRCFTVVLSIVLLFSTIPASGSTNAGRLMDTDITLNRTNIKTEVGIASESDAIMDEDDIVLKSSSTSDGESGKTALTNVTIIRQPEGLITIDSTYQLKANITPSAATVAYRWSTTNPNVATIDGKALLTITGFGTTTITLVATAKNGSNYTGTVTDSFELTVAEEVSPIQINGVTITSKPTTPKHVGDSSFKLRRTVDPEDASLLVANAWSSSNSNVATIDEFGNVTIVGAGTTTIRIEVTGQKGYEGTATDSYELTILPERGAPVPIEKVVITGKPTVPHYVGDASYKVRFATTPYGAAVNPTWTSSNPSAATIDLNGNIAIVGAGKTTIKLEVTGKDGFEGTVSDSFVLTVLSPTLTLDKNEVFLDRGESAVVTINSGPEHAKLMKELPLFYQADGIEGQVSWPGEYLSTSSVENGKFPDNKLSIKIEDTMPEHIAYGQANMSVLLLKPDAVVEEGQTPTPEDILIKEVITIYFREKKASILPPVKPGIPRVDRLKDKLDQIDMDTLTIFEKKELANEVLASLEQQKITTRHTIGNESLEKDLVAVEEILKELLGITPKTSGSSPLANEFTFTGSLFNVPGGKMPVVIIENETVDSSQTNGMGISAGCNPVALDIKLATEDGSTITKIKVPMQLRISASALGLNTKSKIVIKHIKNNGTSLFLPYTIENSEIVFWVSDYSTFIFANGSANSNGGTSTGGGGGSGGGGGGSSSTTRSVATATTPVGSWQQDTVGWKFAQANGRPLSSTWVELTWNGKANWYHFNAQGYADGGWLQDGSHTYYLNPLHNGDFGSMMIGWQQIEGKWYYFQPQASGPMGAMLKNASTPDGFWVGVDGVRP